MPIKIICLFFAILGGCASYFGDVQPSKMINDFFRLSTSEQLNEFKNHNLEEQYDLFLFGNQTIHPPAIYLARSFAEQGSIIVPFLKTKLESTHDEATIRDITAIFSELSSLRLYNFQSDFGLMDLLEQKANSMQGIWKETTLKMISEIRSAGN